MSEVEERFVLTKRYQKTKPNVWIEYNKLASKYKPVNLGQGFQDYAVPKYITNGLAAVAVSPNPLLQQYTRGHGHPRVVEALAKLYSQLIGRDIDAKNEIITTIGAYGALDAAITGHTDVGDEVIILEPFFDCYEPMVKYAGGIPVFVPLTPKESRGKLPTSADWTFDRGELEKAFNKKTKLIIVNSPNNPLGKIFSMEELTFIAYLCKKWNVVCIYDEVYEWIVYQPHKHIRMATLPGMWERTITIGSAGKAFSVTGWKMGWAYSPKYLMNNLHIVVQNSGVTPIQESVAIAMEKEIGRFGRDDCFFFFLPKELEAKKDYMAKMLRDVGMIPTIPDGGYFMLADYTPIESKVDMNSEKDKYKDYRFTKWMIKNLKLLGIPVSAFYSEQHKHLAENHARYCFIKSAETLKKAETILQEWKKTW
uniref:Kynurenine--oxoglutarate transaminase 3-like n=1 Tax=Diabrotica virgifera virgifera TaxID=50390 RepID=A0A6P7FSF1_DIAVI